MLANLLKIKAFLVMCLFFFFNAAAISAPAPTSAATPCYSHNQKLYDELPWMLTYYYGITGDNALIQMLAGSFNRWPEHVQSAELTKTLDENNFLRRLVNPLVGVVQLAGNFTVRNGSREHTIYEFDPYVAFRWANFPWNDYVTTSLAIGEGISYASSVPWIEKRHNQNTKRLLNYLMLEATFALPMHPELQLVARIHHRSGAFGLYHAGNSGSNVIGLGVRYLFE